MNKIMGIYRIYNYITNKSYIGSSVNIKERWQEHRRRLRNNTHENIFLQRAYNKYGKENFKFIIHEVVSDESKLIEIEQYWIDNFKCTNKKYGYNINPIAGKPPSRIGYKHKEETKIKIKNTNTGQKRTKYSKDKMRKAHLGKSNYLKAKKIINLDTLKEFDRIKDAAKYYNIHYGNICLACKGKRNIAGGYRWKYLNDYNKELNTITQTKLEFFKNTLNEFLKLKSRNEKYDKMANEILDNDMTHDFPVYLSDNFCYPYESLVLKSLAQLWNNPEHVEDWINYLLYDAMNMKGGGKAIDKNKNKEYIIKDVDSLCIYLLDYYKLNGE